MWTSWSFLCITLFCLAEACQNASFFGLTRSIGAASTVNAESILKGPIYQLANYKECIYEKKEQYCLANVLIYSDNSSSPFWRQIQKHNSSLLYFRRDLVLLGLCIPESCSLSDTQVAAFDTLESAAESLGVHININLDQSTCQSSHHSSFTTADCIVGAVVLLILATVCTGTFCEAKGILRKDEEEKQNTVERVLLCFSLITNWKKLYPSKESENARVLSSLEGLRVILLYCVIAIHRLYFITIGALVNPEWLEQALQNPMNAFFPQSHPSLAVYFCIGGFLLGLLIHPILEKRSFTFSLHWLAIIHRYIRLTPAYAIVIALSATWMNYAGSGPLWPLLIKTEVENCRNYWWTNLLYINNYIHSDKLCLLHSWYIAADFQNYAAALLVLMVVNKYKQWTKTIFGAALAISITVPLIQTYVEKLDASVFIYPKTVRHLLDDKTFQKTYITFHGNAAPYLLGVMFGTVSYMMKHQGLRIPKVAILLMHIYSLTVPFYILYLGCQLYLSSSEYGMISTSVFAALYKAGFALGIGMFLLMLSRGSIGKSNRILNCKVLQVISPFVYCMYLVHFVLQRIDTANMKEALIIKIYYLASRGMVDFILSFGAGVILCLCVEMPSLALYKLFIPSGKDVKHKKQ